VSDRFFVDAPLPPGEFLLAGPEAHHLAAVRRFAPGGRVVLFNGDGHDYPAEIVSADRKRVALTVRPGVPADRELGFVLHVAAAMPKADRGDFLVEKLTELGVTRFTPLLTARSVVQPKESRADRLRRAVIEASKQCGRNVLMAVDPPQTWDAFVARPDLPPARWLLHTAPGTAGGIGAGAAVIAVGPEGGFTDAEVVAAVAAGWRAVSLGPRVLRVETAAVGGGRGGPAPRP
jgi:16S rRNA (uracil1498-N3)-methyltransferase